MLWLFPESHGQVVDLSTGVTVTSVGFSGVSSTSQKVLHSARDTLLGLARETPFADVASAARACAARLHALGCFERVDVLLDVDTCSETGMAGVAVGGGSAGTELANDGSAIESKRTGVTVLFALVEKEPRCNVMHGRLGESALGLNATVRAINPMGYAEVMEASVSHAVQSETPIWTSSSPFSSQRSTVFKAVFTKPFNSDASAVLALSGIQQATELATCLEHVSSLKAALKFTDAFVGARHEVSYTAAWRRLASFGSTLSDTVKVDAGESLKSALAHVAELDTRNDAGLPTTGHFIQSQLEAVGLGGDVTHVQARGEAQMNFPLGRGFSVASTVKSGILWPLGLSPSSRFNDHFILRGARSLRGFALGGVGPTDGNNVVGGNLFTSLALSLYTPLPLLVDQPFKGHLFANAGSLVKFAGVRDLSASTRELFEAFSSAVGVGVAAHYGRLQFDLNYLFPVNVNAGDRVQAGLQFGVAVDFE